LCDQFRLWQRNSRLAPENSTALSREEFKNSLLPFKLTSSFASARASPYAVRQVSSKEPTTELNEEFLPLTKSLEEICDRRMKVLEIGGLAHGFWGDCDKFGMGDEPRESSGV
jgi:hypothetical protein